MDYYVDLGMLELPPEILTHLNPRQQSRWEKRKARLTGDRESLKELIMSDDRRAPSQLSRHALDLARLGFAAEAEQILVQIEGYRGQPEASLILTCRGTLAFARGSFDEAIFLLQQGLPVLRSQASLMDYVLGAEILARAWDAVGQPEQGVRVLEEASREKSRFVWGKIDWMKAQLRLAELYRQVGQEAEALAVEEELRQLTVYADPKSLIVQELRARHQPVSVGVG